MHVQYMYSTNVYIHMYMYIHMCVYNSHASSVTCTFLVSCVPGLSEWGGVCEVGGVNSTPLHGSAPRPVPGLPHTVWSAATHQS